MTSSSAQATSIRLQRILDEVFNVKNGAVYERALKLLALCEPTRSLRAQGPRWAAASHPPCRDLLSLWKSYCHMSRVDLLRDALPQENKLCLSGVTP